MKAEPAIQNGIRIFARAVLLLVSFWYMTISIANAVGAENNENSADLDNYMAVSGELLGGSQEDVNVKSAYATVTTPPRFPVAFHLEAVHDDAEGDVFDGVGGHLYYRHKDWGMLGITGVKSSIDLAETDEFPAIENLEVSTYGVELEVNIASLVFALQSGRIDSYDLEFERDNYNNIELHWFASDSWHTVFGSQQFSEETTRLLETDYVYVRNNFFYGIYAGGTWDAFENTYIGLEFGSASRSRSNWLFFVEYDKGEQDYDAVFAGVSLAFGPVESAPIQSLFQRNTGGYSFISTQSGVSIIDEGM